MCGYKLYTIFYIIIATKYNKAAVEVNNFEDESLIFPEDRQKIASKMIIRTDSNDRINELGFGRVNDLKTRPVEILTSEKTTEHIGLVSNSPRNAYFRSFNDKYWKYQWYMHDLRVAPGPVMDHNLEPVYEKGYKGVGVIVGVIGDGVQRMYLGAELSEVREPDPLYIFSKSWQHYSKENYDGVMKSEGTRMAGVISMEANNKKCGVGVAFRSHIVGIKIRYKSPIVDESKLAEAITYYKFESGSDSTLCYIYAFAVGRPNDGTYMQTTAKVKDAFKKGAMKGRGGKGSIYVVGAGDGKTSGQDNCGADDLANDPHTIVIASADHRGKVTPYSERCAAVMATAYSSGAEGDEEAVVTLDIGEECIRDYRGNYPSVGIAAGIFALVLESNPKLTPRDMQHLVAMTAEVAPLVDNWGTWTQNKAGFYISNDFGFGLLNAENMVVEAEKWKDVAWRKLPQLKKFDAVFDFNTLSLALDKPSTGTATVKSPIEYMEQVELITTVTLKYRGSLKMELKSPLGTNVVMLEQRLLDFSASGLKEWRMKTPHFWGENPEGSWTITVLIAKIFPEEDSPDPPTCGSSCGLSGFYRFLFKVTSNKTPDEIVSIKLVVHGTEKAPDHYLNDKEKLRTYSAFYSSELHGKKF